MNKLKDFLADVLQVAPDLIPQVMSYYREETIDKNVYLAEKDCGCSKLYHIEEGYVRFFNYTEEKVITHWIFGPGQLVTDVAGFFLQEPAKWHIQTLTPVKASVLSYEDYQRLRSDIAPWDLQEKKLIIKLMAALENRVYALLSMNAEERYQYLYRSDSEMFNQLPLQYLASMLGMSPETLSRIRRRDVK